MNYRLTDNLTKTMDSAVRFIAGDNHRNAAKLFHKPGYTCELETERGRFFESVMPDKATAEVVLTVYWGISIDEGSREGTDEFIKNINLKSSCSSGVDSSGRVFSEVREPYDIEEVGIELFEKMEKDCAEVIARYYDGLSDITVKSKSGREVCPYGKNKINGY